MSNFMSLIFQIQVYRSYLILHRVDFAALSCLNYPPREERNPLEFSRALGGGARAHFPNSG